MVHEQLVSTDNSLTNFEQKEDSCQQEGPTENNKHKINNSNDDDEEEGDDDHGKTKQNSLAPFLTVQGIDR